MVGHQRHEPYDWPNDERGQSARPRDIGEHLTKAVRAVVRHNPSVSGVIDQMAFAGARNGDCDVNLAKLRGVVFSRTSSIELVERMAIDEDERPAVS